MIYEPKHAVCSVGDGIISDVVRIPVFHGNGVMLISVNNIAQ